MLTHWKRLWCWEGLGAEGEGDDRGWDGWMASLTRWTWVSVNSGNWWWTGRPGVLRFMGSQKVRHDWATDLIWSDKSQGGGFGMGNMCIPVVDSCWCMAKPLQYCKVINLQLNKFIFKKKSQDNYHFFLPPSARAPLNHCKMQVYSQNAP